MVTLSMTYMIGQNSRGNSKYNNNIAQNSDKTKWVNSGFGISLDGVGLWSFGDDFVRNIAIFGIEIIILSYR